MAKDKTSLSSLLIRHMVFLAAASLTLWSVVWMQSEFAAFKEQSRFIREEHIEAQKELLISQVQNVAEYIHYMADQTEQRTRESVKSRVYEAHAIASNLYDQYSATMEPEKIKKMIKDALRPIRFNQGRGYYFAFNLEGVEELFADRPDLEGTNMLAMRGAGGEYVVRDMLQICSEKGEGFYQYLWTKPGREEINFPKIAYVKLFEPYGWVIGTGDYLDDIGKMIQTEVLKRAADLRFGAEGYFFGSTYEGDPLFSNGKITRGTGSVLGLTDPNGVKIILEQQKRVKEHGRGFVRYSWPKLKTAAPSPKISYVQGIPEWEWLIGAGVYLDTVESTISRNEEALFSGFRKKMLKSAAIFLILLAVIIFWSRYVSRKIQNSLLSLSYFFNRAATESAAIDPEQLHYSEFKDIARQANTMLAERKKAGEALRQNEKRLIEAQHIAKMGDFSWDVETGEVTWSDGLHDLLRYQKSEKIDYAKVNAIIHHPDDLERITQWLNDCIASDANELTPNEYRLIRRDGEVVFVRTQGVIQRRQGKPPKVFATVQDISERKVAEEALKENQRQLATLLSNLPGMAYRCKKDPFWTMEILSDGAFPLTGYKPSELIGNKKLSYSDVIHPEDRSMVWDFVQEAVEQGGPYKLSYRIITANGEEKWVWEQGRGVAEVQGGDIWLEGFITDITPRKRAEEEKAKLEGKLRQTQKMESIGRLAGGVAHDFNNMLGVILGHTELALEQLEESRPVFNDLKEIQSAARRSADLTRQLLAFARKQTIAPRVLDLNDVLAGMLSMLQRLIGEDKTLVWLPGANLWQVKMDPSQVDQILANLCINARDAISGVGRVTIETQNATFDKDYAGEIDGLQPGEYVLLAVSDDGRGMEKKELEYLFEPFFTTKDVGEGTGLGLATIYGIVKQNDGFINVYSEPGEGTTFKIYLPRHEGPYPGGEDEKPAEVQTGHGETVLIVEDEAAILNMGRKMLERLGYRVLTAGSPVEALRLARESAGEIHLLVTDVIMPEMNGRELAERLQAQYSGLKVLYMSGYTANVIAHHGVLDENVDFVQKPFTLMDLAAVVSKSLQGK